MHREARRGENRERFGEANARSAAMSEQRRQAVVQSFMCECSRADCARQLEVPLAVYADLDKAPGSFLVIAGHEDPECEIVMGGHSSYRIVWTKLTH